MPYLIDGHNLIGQMPDISLDDPNDEALLVQKLSGFVARKRQKCVVVFDHGVPGGVSRMSNRGVQVVFASPPHNADQLIMRRIHNARDPKNWTVVSSDNQVLEMARRRRMQIIRSSDFVEHLRRPPEPERPGPDEAPDVRLTEEEIEMWLREFNQRNNR
ncbi:MAG: NYN domain-containing protein [Phototrophicaceae bacterium]